MEENIKIGPILYKVKLVGNLVDDEDGTSLDGHIKHSSCIILLRKDLPEQRIKQVLWHELLHGIMEMMGIDQSEQSVEALSSGIMLLLQDNPWLAEEV